MEVHAVSSLVSSVGELFCVHYAHLKVIFYCIFVVSGKPFKPDPTSYEQTGIPW